MKKITINRQSICMADDIEDHKAQIIVSDTCSYLDFIEEVRRVKYLPPYDIIWLLRSERSGFIAAYYNSSTYNHIFWQRDINENEAIRDNESFCFDCEQLKKEMWKYATDYEKLICRIKSEYNISDELFNQIEEYLRSVRGSANANLIICH